MPRVPRFQQQQRFGPASVPQPFSPGAARREGEAVAGLGASVTKFGSSLARYERVKESAKRNSFSKDASIAGERAAQDVKDRIARGEYKTEDGKPLPKDGSADGAVYDREIEAARQAWIEQNSPDYSGLGEGSVRTIESAFEAPTLSQRKEVLSDSRVKFGGEQKRRLADRLTFYDSQVKRNPDPQNVFNVLKTAQDDFQENAIFHAGGKGGEEHRAFQDGLKDRIVTSSIKERIFNGYSDISEFRKLTKDIDNGVYGGFVTPEQLTDFKAEARNGEIKAKELRLKDEKNARELKILRRKEKQETNTMQYIKKLSDSKTFGERQAIIADAISSVPSMDISTSDLASIERIANKQSGVKDDEVERLIIRDLGEKTPDALIEEVKSHGRARDISGDSEEALLKFLHQYKKSSTSDKFFSHRVRAGKLLLTSVMGPDSLVEKLSEDLSMGPVLGLRGQAFREWTDLFTRSSPGQEIMDPIPAAEKILQKYAGAAKTASFVPGIDPLDQEDTDSIDKIVLELQRQAQENPQLRAKNLQQILKLRFRRNILATEEVKKTQRPSITNPQTGVQKQIQGPPLPSGGF